MSLVAPPSEVLRCFPSTLDESENRSRSGDGDGDANRGGDELNGSCRPQASGNSVVSPTAASGGKQVALGHSNRHQGASHDTATTDYCVDLGSVASASQEQQHAPGKRKKKKGAKKIVNVALTKYQIIREVAVSLGFVIQGDGDEDAVTVDRGDFNLLWTDTVLPMQRLTRLARWQRTNHFPSMSLLCRKVHLGITLGRLRRLFPAQYNFYPRTFSLRSERQQFSHYLSTAGRRKTFILKPNAGCQGRGIILTRDPLNAVEDLDQYVVQEYVSKPLLIEKKKFDLRVYCLVTSVRHLTVYLFNQGLVRICAEEYQRPTEENLSMACMHLTNYAVNKHHSNFEFNTDANNSDTGSKRDFRFLNKWLSSQGHDVAHFWDRIAHMINKALIAAQPQLAHVYCSLFPRDNDGWTCFEVLGFDVMVDEKMKPWLLEVNHTPSLACDTPLDYSIKSSLVEETWRIINIHHTDKQRHRELERARFERRMAASKGPGEHAGVASAASPAAAAAAAASSSSAGAGPLASPTAPPASSLSSASSHPDAAASPTDVAGGAASAADAETAAVEERRAAELARLVNFKRIFPACDPARREQYEQMLAAARDATGIQSTASQDQRQAELRGERERREAMKRAHGAKGSASASSAQQQQQQQHASARAPAVRHQTGEAGGQQAPPVPTASTVATRGSGRPAHTTGASAHGHSHSAPPPPLSSSSSVDNTHTPSGTAPVPASSTSSTAGGGGGGGVSGAEPSLPQRSSRRTREEKERMRRRLEEQMARHRRRMTLGPRLSVFQLRDAQMAAAVAGEDYDFFVSAAALQQQQQQQDAVIGRGVAPQGSTGRGRSSLGSTAHHQQHQQQQQQQQHHTRNPQYQQQLQRYQLLNDTYFGMRLPIYDLSHSVDTGEGFDE